MDLRALFVNTRTLSERWAVDQRTVLRVLRFHGLPERRLRPGGRILFDVQRIIQLESDLFKLN